MTTTLIATALILGWFAGWLWGLFLRGLELWIRW